MTKVTDATYLNTSGVIEVVRKKVMVPRLKTDWNLNKFAFFGSADVDEESEVYKEALGAAKELASEGKIIVNGGGPGVMEASTRGAILAGGQTVAVTFYPEDMPEFEGRDSMNEVDLEIKTTNYIERMMGLLSEADAFVCFKGGTGTLSEWATAWLLAHLYYGHHKPLFLYGGFWHEYMDVTKRLFFIEENEQKVYRIVESKEELCEAIREQEAIFKEKKEAEATEGI